MKKSIFLNLMMVLAITLFNSCNNDVKNKPAVAIHEANIEGSYICVEADIEAQNKTRSIRIEVKGATDGQVKVAKEYTDTKYVGKLSVPEFHEHIDIDDSGVKEGDLLSMTGTDHAGLQTTESKPLTEEEEDEDE
ncbi:MAG: hypothetical protein K6A36_01915 [Paludibacteraceae bacterium]|nr:hypothetical protein [Paludibacteraceae bacterium]